jgi:putative membrane protein
MMLGNGFGMEWGWLFGALVVVGLVLVAVVVVRVFAGGYKGAATGAATASQEVPGAGTSARQILDERYAAGELSTEEYEERLRVLGSGS